MNLQIYGVQLDCVWENKDANFAKVRAILAAAPPKSGALIILPEMFATGFSCNLPQTIEPVEGPTEIFLREIARQHECAVLGGVVTPGSDGKGRNQALAIGPDGTTLARYTKMQPFSMGGETEVHERGAAPQIFEWSGVKIAPLICYDLRFPEIARDAIRAGAEVLIYIAAWPIKRQQHWITLLQARAIENQAFVIGINRCGKDPQFTYSGRSLVADPQGALMADAYEGEAIIMVELDASVVRDWRDHFPALKDAGMVG